MQTDDGWELFWSLVDQYREDRRGFDARIRSMDQSELVELYRMYEMAVADLKGDSFAPFWGDRSEDYIDGSAYDIVAQGKQFYERVLEQPERVRDPVDADPGHDARGDIMQVYEERFGAPLWDRL